MLFFFHCFLSLKRLINIAANADGGMGVMPASAGDATTLVAARMEMNVEPDSG